MYRVGLIPTCQDDFCRQVDGPVKMLKGSVACTCILNLISSRPFQVLRRPIARPLCSKSMRNAGQNPEQRLLHTCRPQD